MLSILSGSYPFFRAPDDISALMEIITVFGTDELKDTAKKLGMAFNILIRSCDKIAGPSFCNP